MQIPQSSYCVIASFFVFSGFGTIHSVLLKALIKGRIERRSPREDRHC